MGWARFDDAYTDHPKVVSAGPLAELLDMRAILFSARYETDGHIPPAQVTRIGAGISALRKRIAALVEVDRWHEAGHECKDCPQILDGWVVHDYLNYNPASTKKEAEREAARERMRKAREAKQTPNNPRSSPDVRPNNQRSSPEVQECSDNPVPSPTSPNGDGAEAPSDAPPLIQRVASWLATEHGVEFEESPNLHAMYEAVMRQALPLLSTPKQHDTAMGLVCEYAERVNGEKLPADHRKRLGRLIKGHLAEHVLYAVAQSMDWGAGLSGEHATDPRAWLNYCTAVVSKREAS